MPIRPLPSIPFESWVADQQDLLEKKISGLFPALEFRTAATDLESEIPPDYPYIGGSDTFELEQQRIRELEERQAQAEEEERRRQQAAAEEQQRRDAEQARQQGIFSTARSMMVEAGIPTPDQIYGQFQSLVGTRPGLGDQQATTGAFDPDITPYDQPITDPAARDPIYDFGPELGQPLTPEGVQTVEDFRTYAQGVDERVLGPEAPSPPGLVDEALGAGRGVWEGVKATGQGALDYAEEAGTKAFEYGRRFTEASGRGLSAVQAETVEGRTGSSRARDVGATLGNVLQTLTGAEAEDPAEIRRRIRSSGLTPPEVVDAFQYLTDLGFQVASGSAAQTILRELRTEAGVPALVKWGEGEEEQIGPEDILAPDPLAGGMRSVPGLATRAAYGTGVAGAIERGTGAAIAAGGRAAARTAGHLADEYGTALGTAGEVVGRGLQTVDRLAGRAYDNLLTTPQPEMAGAIQARAMPRAETRQPGFRRMYHGTATPFEQPEGTFFDEEGLFGPAYYLTSDPRVAGGIISESGDRVISAGYAQRGLAFGDEATQAHVRPTDIDDRAVLYHADKPVPPTDFRRIVGSLHRLFGDSEDEGIQTLLQDYSRLASQPNDAIRSQILHGEDFYHDLAREFTLPEQAMDDRYWTDEGFLGSKAIANQILAEAGFDGVYYTGGSRIGFTDEGGKQVQHDVAAIFPEKLDAIRNALTGEIGGAIRDRGRGGRLNALFQVHPDMLGPEGSFGPGSYLTTRSEVAANADELLVPKDLNLLSFDDRVLSAAHLRNLVQSLNRVPGFNRDSLQDALAQTDSEQLTARRFYDAVVTAAGDQTAANRALAASGIDGLQYSGRDLLPLRGQTGKSVGNMITMVFPESTEQIRLPRSRSGSEAGGAAQAGMESAAQLAARSRGARTGGGAAFGAAGGAAAGDEEDTVGERAAKIAGGAVAGGLGLRVGTQAAARLTDSLIARGALSSDVISSHPLTPDRIRALFALAAKNLPDDARVEIPGMVQFLTRTEPDVRAQVADLIDGPKTAGQIREIVSQGIDPERLGRSARDLIVDLVAGVGGRARRGAELRADRATIAGVGRNPLAGLAPEPYGTPEAPGRARTVRGDATEVHDPEIRGFIHGIADELGVARPHVWMIDRPEATAWATKGRDQGGTSLFLSRGLASADLAEDEARALVTHELSHTTEQSLGAELLGMARGAFETLAGAARLPARGVWRARMQEGMQLPEGIPEHRANEIRRAYDESMRLLENSQNPKLKARNQIRWQSRAHDAWDRYEALRQQATKESGRAVRTSPRARPAAQAADAATELGAEILPVGEAPPGTGGAPRAVPPEPAELVPPGRAEPVGEALPRVADEFEPEPLPEVWSPQQRISHEDAGKLIGQLREEVALDPKAMGILTDKGTQLLGMPKIRGRHIEQLLGWIGQVRALPNRGVRPRSTEEASAEWADEFLRKNGWLAPRAVPSRQAPVDEAAARITSRSEPSEVEALRLRDSGDIEGPTDEVLRALEARGAPELGRIPDPELLDEIPIIDFSDENMAGAIRRRIDPARLPPGADLDPRYQSRGQATAPGKITNPGLIERIYQHWAPKLTDSIARLQGYQNDLAREFEKQTGLKLPVEALAAELKRLDPNRMAEMDADTYMKPAVRIFRKLGFADENVNTYLSYKQDIDIVRHQAQQSGNLARELPDGTDYAHAVDWVNNWEAHQAATLAPEQKQALDYALQSVWDLGDRILLLKRDAGLIDDAAYQAMRDAYPHYMPTKILDFINDDTRVGVGQSLSVTGNTIHALSKSGTQRTALDSMPALYGALYEAHAAANKNRVFNAFVEMWDIARALPSVRSHPPGWVTQPVGVKEELFGTSERRVAEFADYILEKPPASHRTNEFVTVQGFRDGVKQQYWVHKDLGDVTKYESPVAIPLLSGLAAAFRAGATARNPVFLTANAFLDLSTYMIRESSRAGGPQHLYDVLQVYGATAGEFLLDPRRWKQIAGDIAAHEYRGDMRQFLAAGGGSSGLVGRSALRPEPVQWKGGKFDVDDLLEKLGVRQQSELEQGLERLGRGALEINNAADAMRILKDLVTLKPVEAIGERIELIPRVAAMRLAERRGASAVETIVAGRTTTIDFSKGGTWAKTINQLIPFFNVGVQATADMQRALVENLKPFAATLGTAIVTPMVIAELWNQADPQRKQDYDDVPSYLKDQGLVVMLPEDVVGPAPIDAQGNRHPQFFHFRYRQFAPIAILTREVMQRWFYDGASDEDRRGALEMGLSALGQMSPVSASDPLDLATSLTPLGVQTGLQLGFDYDAFRGKRIKSAYADERASPLSQGLAERFGGRASQWEFGTRDIGTGYAGMLHGASEILFGERKDRPSPQNIPGAGGLIGRVVKGSIGEEAERARQTTVTPSAEKILSAEKITWRPAEVAPEIEDVPLLRSEYAAYQREVNQVTDQVIQELGRDPKWRALSKADKQAILEREVNKERVTVRKNVLIDIPKSERDARLRKLEAEGKLPAVRSRR
jgi:hypothetical protein